MGRRAELYEAETVRGATQWELASFDVYGGALAVDLVTMQAALGSDR
jgi:hypothetical protein